MVFIFIYCLYYGSFFLEVSVVAQGPMLLGAVLAENENMVVISKNFQETFDQFRTMTLSSLFSPYSRIQTDDL